MNHSKKADQGFQGLSPLSEIVGKLIYIQEAEETYDIIVKSSRVHNLKLPKEKTTIIVEKQPKLQLDLYEIINTKVSIFRTLTDFRIIFEKGEVLNE